MKPAELYRKAIGTYGSENQMRMLQEECAELIVAVNHGARNRITMAGVAEEIADVMIMCEQARLIVGQEMVDVARTRKLKRLSDEMAALRDPGKAKKGSP